jgi:hypothetical protein
MKLQKGYIIPAEPYIEPYVVIWKGNGSRGVANYNMRNPENPREIIAAPTLAKLYRKLAYRAQKENR